MVQIEYEYNPYFKNSYVATICEGEIVVTGVSAVSYADAKDRVIKALLEKRHMVAINKMWGGVAPPSEEINF